MSFSQKLLTVSLNLANGQFEGGGNTATITGLRMSCHIEATGGVSQSNMELAIYGLPLSLMNQLSTVGTQFNQRSQNSITVEAGDAESGMTLVFGGVIYNAFVDAQSMPQVCFRIMASPAAYHAVKPVKPISINGAAKVSDLMKTLAGQMGLGFEDVGVKAVLSSPYYPGNSWTQAIEIARHAGINMIVEADKMVIAPRGTARSGDATLISPQTGMVGYPAFIENCIIVKTLFNKGIRDLANITVQSDLTAACGTWTVGKIDYELECLTPHGKWFQIVRANPPGTL